MHTVLIHFIHIDHLQCGVQRLLCLPRPVRLLRPGQCWPPRVCQVGPSHHPSRFPITRSNWIVSLREEINTHRCSFLCRYFKEASEEEREHAEKLMAYQVQGDWTCWTCLFMTADSITLIRKYCSFLLFGHELNQCWKITYLRSRLEFKEESLWQGCSGYIWCFCSPQPSDRRAGVHYLVCLCLMLYSEQAWRKSKAECHRVASDGVWPCWKRGCSLL